VGKFRQRSYGRYLYKVTHIVEEEMDFRLTFLPFSHPLLSPPLLFFSLPF
jgi:hypothetical protein